VEYKGQWYQFYHNKSLSGQGNLRSICVDKVNFNEDGTIQMIVQTKSGVPSVGTAPLSNPKAVKYDMADAVASGGATIGNDTAANGGKCGLNLHLAGAGLQVKAIDGGEKDGQATINIHYATAERGKLKLTVNDVDYSFINIFPTGGWNQYSGLSSLTVPLRAGKNNTVQLTGGNGGVNVDYIEVCPL
jgi:hypothetical protein